MLLLAVMAYYMSSAHIKYATKPNFVAGVPSKKTFPKERKEKKYYNKLFHVVMPVPAIKMRKKQRINHYNYVYHIDAHTHTLTQKMPVFFLSPTVQSRTSTLLVSKRFCCFFVFLFASFVSTVFFSAGFSIRTDATCKWLWRTNGKKYLFTSLRRCLLSSLAWPLHFRNRIFIQYLFSAFILPANRFSANCSTNGYCHRFANRERNID